MENVKECGIVLGKEIVMISVEEIMPNRRQPRRIFECGSIEELADSIEKYGVLQPIVVRECEDLEGFVFKYELVAGERRLRAARMAGFSEIPCVIVDVDDKESAELAIIENLHRKDLNIFEMAEAISGLIDVYGVTQEEIARRLSITQSAVANKLRLLRLSEEERRIIIDNGLSERHARCLLRIPDLSERYAVLECIVAVGMNVKESEEYIGRVLSSDGVENSGIKSSERLKRGDCVNIIQRAIEKIRKIGRETKSTCTETDEFYIYTITVDKK